MKILVVIDQLAFGGAGRVASILVNGLATLGHDVTIETNCHLPVNYTVGNNVKIVSFFGNIESNRLTRVFKRIKTHRKHLREIRPDVIISFMPTMFFEMLIAKIGLDIPIIVSDHTSMGRDLGLWINFIRHNLYGIADSAVILTRKDYKYLGNRIPQKTVIYNPLTFEPSKTYPHKKKIIMCAGRIDAYFVKGFDRMIKIWGILSPRYTDWKLVIAGAGSRDAFNYLKNLADKHGVSKATEFLGQVDDIKKLYLDCEIFALPSRVEGFPMVLIEAMSQGCACVSFSMQGAIEEIVTNGKNGFIVSDGQETDFCMTLERLISDPTLVKDIGMNAMIALSHLSPETFFAKWDFLIKQVISARNNL